MGYALKKEKNIYDISAQFFVIFDVYLSHENIYLLEKWYHQTKNISI